MQKDEKLFLKKDHFFWITIFFALIIIVTPFENGPLHHFISNRADLFINSFFGYRFFHKEVCFYISDFFILTIFFVYLFRMKKLTFLYEKSSLYLLVFVLLLLVSTLISKWARASQFFLVFNFFTTYLLFSCLSSLLNEKNVYKFLNVVLGALLLVSAFECFLGFYQYFAQKSLGLKCLHEPFFSQENLGLASFYSSNGSKWIFDDLFHLENKAKLILRATGSFGHANNFGGFIFFSTIASVYFFLFSKKKWQKNGMAFFLFFQIFAMFLSYSRSAIFGFCIAVFCFYLIFFLKRKGMVEEYALKMKRLAFVIAGSLLLSFVLLYPQLIERGGVLTYNNLSKASDRGRLNFQVVAFEMIKKHPLTGVGYQRFHERCAEFIPQDKKNEFCTGIVHNIYLLIASENGIITLLVFLLFIFSIYRAFFKKSNLISMLFISFFMGFLFVGCCDYYLIDKTAGKIIFFFLPVVVSALGSYEKLSCKNPLNLSFLNSKS